jgi:phosphoribosylaminoimidazole-succinocarboxamide synthase
MVTVGRMAEPYKVEMVIRAYLTGHAWREYKSGKRSICGEKLPEGLKEHDKLPQPILTPTTKATEGHDLDISRDEIISSGLVSASDYSKLEEYTMKLFARGTEMAAEKGLILVDTKYEFGKIGEEILLIDEIHTPDSSRYFYAEGYAERQSRGEEQKQLSKEFVRQWLIERNFQGKEGQQVPDMPDSFVEQVSLRYIELFEQITGEKFQRADTSDIENRIYRNVAGYLEKLV